MEDRNSDSDDDDDGRCILMSVRDCSLLLSPITSAHRIKYTSVTASSNYIALGANTGGVYCFYRKDYQYIRILANQEGCVSLLSISPAENSLAVCCGGGYVSLWELNLTKQGISKRVHSCTLLKDAMVTDMVWDNKSSRLYLGDDHGRLAVSYMPKKVFKKSDEILLQEKSIVQMDLYQDLLLVSTVTRCVIFNVVSHEVIQVGKRQRDGLFGSCFHVRWPGKPPVVYSARPGRLWEADIKGTVVSTLRLKELITTPATPLLGHGYEWTLPSPSPSLPLNFSTLSILSHHYLVCWSPTNGALSIFHSLSYQLAGWTEVIGQDYTLQCNGEELLLLSKDGRGLKVIEFVSLSKCLQGLVKLGQFHDARQVIEDHAGKINQLLPTDHTLLHACKAIVMVTKVPLSQQLLMIEDTVNTLTSHDVINGIQESPGCVASDGGCVASDGGCGTEEVDSRDLQSKQEVQDKPEVEDKQEVENVDFPFQLADPQEILEPDLDSTLNEYLDSTHISDERTTNNTIIRSVDTLTSDHTPPLLDDPTHQEEDNIVTRSNDHEVMARSNDPEIVARSLSRVIPDLQNSVEGLGDHTLNSDRGSGHVSSIVNKSMVERLSWQQDSLEDDIIAVPMLVRSTSTGSKTKSKKKSRRKKTQQKQQLEAIPTGSSSSLPVSPSSSSLLIHIPEELELPFPEVGLPHSQQSSPPTSHSASPYPSLPATPPQSLPPSLDFMVEAHGLNNHTQDHTQDTPPTQVKVESKSQDNKKGRGHDSVGGGARTQRSSSIDIRVADAFSKVKSMALQSGQTVSQKVVKGFLSSLSSPSPSYGSGGHMTSQPMIYNNNDDLTGSIEEGRFALSPLSDDNFPTPSLNQAHPQTLTFSNVTIETRAKLDDSAIFCSVDKIIIVLQTWLKSLELYTSILNTSSNMGGVPSLLTPPLPFSPLSSTLVSTVTHLATLCAELAVYSSNSVLSNAEVASCDQPHTPFDNLEDFISGYIEVLDVNRLRNFINQQTWSVREKTWGALISAGDFVSPLFGVPSSTMYDKDILPSLCISEDFISHSLNYFPRLMPWEVALACHVQSRAGDKSCDHHLYVMYLSQLLGNKDSSIHEEIVKEIFTNDSEFLLMSLRVVLEEEGQNHTHTADGKPRPGSHMIEWAESECLECLVCMCIMVGGATSRAGLDICRTSGYWIGVLRLLVAMGDKQEALKTILVLGDMRLLTQHQPWGELLGNLSDWKEVVEALTETTPTVEASAVTIAKDSATPTVEASAVTIAKDSTTPTDTYAMPPSTNEAPPPPCDGHTHSSAPLNKELHSEHACMPVLLKKREGWGVLFQHMLCQLSPQDIHTLLSTMTHDVMGENPHSTLITITTLHTQQRVIAHGLLEKIDRYLWSPRPSVIVPHIYRTLSMEKDMEAIKDSTLPSLPYLSSSHSFVLPSLEEVDLHWGVRTHGSSNVCSMCHVSLVAIVSDKIPGVVTFQCGHAHHKICVPELACPICFAENSKDFIGTSPSLPSIIQY